MDNQKVDTLFGGMIVIILGITIALVIQFFIAKQFEKIAIMKGHPNAHAFAWCFWLGIVGYIYVAALPNISLNNTILKNKANPTTNAAFNRYTCNSIIKTEKVTSGKCFGCYEFYPDISFCKINKGNNTVEFPVCDKCIEKYEQNAKNR